jgi:dTDP-glucose pyrophosphorylase
MIIIPMLGKSSRFKEMGYSLPKYELNLGESNVFLESIKSFKNQFNKEHFLFLTRKDYNGKKFVEKEIKKLNVKEYKIIEFDKETKGQAESVYLGIKEYSKYTPLIIFNIDTIRKNFEYPNLDDCSGFLEVFDGVGDSWSFIKPGINGNVIETVEKKRISNLCSNGLYWFKYKYLYDEAFIEANERKQVLNGEYYVAPLYNYLIKNKHKIKYIQVENKLILNCGVPKDYEIIRDLYK